MEDTTVRVRLLATSDVHMDVLGFNYYSDQAEPGRGLEATAPLIQRLRTEAQAETPARHSLLFDNGDILQGTPLGQYLPDHLGAEDPHPLAAVVNRLGYDAMGLGNHDLDYGLDYLRQFARDLTPKLISSNLKPTRPTPWLAPFDLIERGGVKVGVLSVLPTRSLDWAFPEIGGEVAIEDMLWSIKHNAEAVRSAGADLVVALAHTGISEGDPQNVLIDIAASGCVDALIGGHTHKRFPHSDHANFSGADLATGTLHGCPTVMPGPSATSLGVIDLDLQRGDGGNWSVAQGRARLEFPDHRSTAGSALEPIRPFHSATRAALNAPVGMSPSPLTSYFSLLTPGYLHALMASAFKHAINQARTGGRYDSLPLLASVSAKRVGGRGGADNYTDIPAGPINARDLAQINTYANKVWAVCVTGAELREWLESSVSIFRQHQHASQLGLIDEDMPGFDFDTIFGVRYDVDLTQPARYDRWGSLKDPQAYRIKNLFFEGSPIDHSAEFLVAVESYRACGGGNRPGLRPDRPVLRPRLDAMDVLRAFLRTGQPIQAEAVWRFDPLQPKLGAWIDTGPGAIAHLGDIAHLSPGTPQTRPDGFIRVPLELPGL